MHTKINKHIFKESYEEKCSKHIQHTKVNDLNSD